MVFELSSIFTPLIIQRAGSSGLTQDSKALTSLLGMHRLSSFLGVGPGHGVWSCLDLSTTSSTKKVVQRILRKRKKVELLDR